MQPLTTVTVTFLYNLHSQTEGVSQAPHLRFVFYQTEKYRKLVWSSVTHERLWNSEVASALDFWRKEQSSRPRITIHESHTF